MEAFSLLKYWRGGGATVDGGANVRPGSTGTTTIVTAVSHHAAETHDDDDDDEGQFFDLEFAVQNEDDGYEQEKHEDNANCMDDGDEEREDDIKSDGTEDENVREFKFTVSPGSSGDRTDQNLSLSPSDDLFFKGQLVPKEPSAIIFNGSEPNAKSQFSLLKSATKFRVQMLKFKKPKANVAEKTDPNGSASETAKRRQNPEEPEQQKQNQPQSKLFTVKFKVEEVPIMSLFSRENSSRVSSSSNKSQKQQSSDESASDEKPFSKDVMQRYLKMVNRASKRYSEKLRFSGQLNLGGTKAGPSPPSAAAQKSPPSAAKGESEPTEVTEPQTSPPSKVKSQKRGNLPAGLRVGCKHLGKSRSASSAPSGSSQTRRRDDSLLQQQDGIQNAILHCKRSFNASRDSELPLLLRSVSDHRTTNPMSMSKNCSEDPKETGI